MASRVKPIRTLLLVDDESNILKALQRTLRADGLVIRTAQSGAEALEKMTEAPADIVISDHRMPDMRGLELLREMRRRWPRVVKLLLTAHADAGATREALASGDVDHCFSKPWDIHELRRALTHAGPPEQP